MSVSIPKNLVGSRAGAVALDPTTLYIGKIRHRDQLHDGQHDAIVDHGLWEAVQHQFEKNGDRKTLRTAAKNPSLLAGLIFDDKNNPMSATHSTKNNRRCRYYISQAILQFREAEAGSVQRIAAEPLEATIIDRLRDLLETANELLSVVEPCDVPGLRKRNLISGAKALINKWDSLTPHEQIAHLKQFVQRILVGRNEIRMTLSRSSLVALLLEDASYMSDQDHASADDYEIIIPVSLKRCGIEMKLIVSNGETPNAHSITIQATQDAVKKGLAWNLSLVTGEVSSMTQLARRENVTQRYIAHLIGLAFLAPDIIETILRGDVPADLSLGRLKKGIPLDWNDQRKTFGFSA